MNQKIIKMKQIKSTYTSIIRDNGVVHILKAKIIDEHYLLFQMKNLNNGAVSPCFKIKADYGSLPFVRQGKIEKEIQYQMSLTKNIRRINLKQYYNQVKLGYLLDKIKTN